MGYTALTQAVESRGIPFYKGTCVSNIRSAAVVMTDLHLTLEWRRTFTQVIR